MIMLSALKLQLNSQVDVRYGDKFDSETYKLLEVDDRLLAELLENGLRFKGGPEDEAVLCSLTATYAVKFVSTSNTVLLVPPFREAKDAAASELGSEEDPTVTGVTANEEKEETSVVATVAGHIELIEISPKLENLKVLLSQQPYKEDVDGEEDVDHEEGLYTWDDLLASVQASECQLRAALKNLDAVEIGGYWRIVDDNYMHSVLHFLLLTALQHEWPLDSLPGLEAVQALEADNISPQIVMHCLETYGIRNESPSMGNAIQEPLPKCFTELPGQETRWAMDERKVCLNYAKQLLGTQTKWKLVDFMEAWQKVLPSGMNPDLDMLKGEVLVDTVGPESWVHHFSISSLPMKPGARFLALFKRRAKWEWEDLEPYLRDLKEPNQSVEAMLLKYTRKTHPTSNSTPIYTAR